jgi:hypothetical protein
MKNGQAKESLTAELNTIFKDMPAALVSREGYLRLAALTDMLPAQLSNFWGLECRLNADEPLADILIEIKNNTRGQMLLAGHMPTSLDSLCADYNVWREIRAFAIHWSQEHSIFNQHILNLWLEFDTERPASHEFAKTLLEMPSVFIGLRSRELSESERAEILHQADFLLHIPESLLDGLQSFMNHIPSSGQLFQLGSMLGRPGRDIRACVNQLEFDAVPGWLSDMGWTGDGRALSEVFSSLSPLLQAFSIDLNLTERGISDKIGIECYMDWDDTDPGQWVFFLDTIQEFVQCSPGKREGLLQYPGSVLLPAASRRTADDILCFSLFKGIHHIKLGFDDGHITDAKAYLSIYKPGMHTNNNWLIE